MRLTCSNKVLLSSIVDIKDLDIPDQTLAVFTSDRPFCILYTEDSNYELGEEYSLELRP